jgi:hypothetical protein
VHYEGKASRIRVELPSTNLDRSQPTAQVHSAGKRHVLQQTHQRSDRRVERAAGALTTAAITRDEKGQAMAVFIATTVQWVILPMIMCAIFTFAWIIASSAKTAELRVSSWVGFWAGLLTFVVYVVSQLGQIQEPKLRFETLPGMQFLELGWGLTTGFMFLWIVRHAVPTRLVGLLTLMLAGLSTSALFTYVFINPARVSVLYWTLGTALGILLHIVLFPTSIAHIFPLARTKDHFLIDASQKPAAGVVFSSGASTSGAAGAGTVETSFNSQPLQPAAV